MSGDIQSQLRPAQLKLTQQTGKGALKNETE